LSSPSSSILQVKKMHLRLNIVEYSKGGPSPLYNLIIDEQTLHDIGTVSDFKERTITIDDIFLPMRNINNLELNPSISRAFKLNSSFAQKPGSTRNATKLILEILDAKYDKTVLPRNVKNNCVKEGAKPYHGRSYPIPKIHKATLMEEIGCLILIGLLKWQPSFKWALPSFIILKKNHTV
jgi:hypothetical protein